MPAEPAAEFVQLFEGGVFHPHFADTLALEGDLSEALGLHVEILDKNGIGEVRVKYATLEQLDELCRRLSRH